MNTVNHKSLRNQVSPWGLSPRQAELMDVLVTLGCFKRAAKALGVTLKTVEVMASNVAEKMTYRSPELDNRVLRIVAWDRWRRSQSAAGQS